MSRKAKHNHKVRARILAAAGERFRTRGYERAQIDAIMESAGLTRGGFYAHFPSKAALLPSVIAEDDILLTLLRGRSDATSDALWAGLRYLIRYLLSRQNFRSVRNAWTLPTLARDAGLGDRTARYAYEKTTMNILDEMARGTSATGDHPALNALLAQTCGAISMASAMDSEAARNLVLDAASEAALKLLDGVNLSRTECHGPTQ